MASYCPPLCSAAHLIPRTKNAAFKIHASVHPQPNHWGAHQSYPSINLLYEHPPFSQPKYPTQEPYQTDRRKASNLEQSIAWCVRQNIYSPSWAGVKLRTKKRDKEKRHIDEFDWWDYRIHTSSPSGRISPFITTHPLPDWRYFLLAALQDHDHSHKPTRAFYAHFVLNHKHPRKLPSRSPISKLL